MQFDVHVAMTWILFLALFPAGFIWFRRAFRILFNRDYSEVALKRGEPPKNPKAWALPVAFVNLTAGFMIGIVIVGVVAGHFAYETWTAIAGVTLWMKIFIDFIISRQAHPFQWGRKKKESSD